MSIPAHSQQFQTESAVVETCNAVALAELADEEASILRGQCIAATQAYIQNVSNRSLSSQEFDQTLANLVVVLANILFNPQCVVESEVARAIALTNAAANDPEQQAQIQLIYETVNACDFVVTAAIFSPTAESLNGGSGGPSGGNGVSVSPSLPPAGNEEPETPPTPPEDNGPPKPPGDGTGTPTPPVASAS
jgi:hypothetical protein